MSDILKYSNQLLISINQGLSECCCNDGNLFWEATPCDMTLQPRSAICAEWDQCQFDNRQYLDKTSRCGGNLNKICECQKLHITDWSNIEATGVYQAVNIAYFGSATGIIEISDTNITLNQPGQPLQNIDITNITLHELQATINALPTFNWNFNFYFLTSDSYPANILATGTLTYNTGAGETQFINTKPPFIKLTWNGNTTSGIVFNSDPDIFAASLQTQLRLIIGVDLIVTHNGIASNSFDKFFEIQFAGSLCGIEQPFVTTNTYTFISLSHFSTATWGYGIYGDGESYLSPGDYTVIGTSGNCPYEDRGWANDSGPAFFDPTITCCPQRGCTVGPNQTVGYEAAFSSISGYCADGCPGIDGTPWANLNRTVILGGNCYNLSPDYFVFGKAGRLTYDYYNNQNLFINPNCDFGTVSGCNQSLPCNCHPQLFLAQFHKDVPWGPFGSYFPGIETTIHKAYTSPWDDAFSSPAGGQSYLSLFINGAYQTQRLGFDYRPHGTMKLRGTWIDTKEIDIQICVHRPVPFYVGTGVYDDLPFYIEIDPTSVSGITVNPIGSAGCDCVNIHFDCSGKTVGDFLDSVNGLMIKDYNCHLFAFCAASDDARIVPASKIINTSSELFEQLTAVDSGLPFGQDGPDSDNNLYSGTDILVGPKTYQTDFADNPENPYGSDISIYNGPPGSAPDSEILAHLPPICRTYNTKLPRATDGDYFDLRRHNNMWITSMQGCVTDIINIIEATGGPVYSAYTVAASGRQIFIKGSGLFGVTPFSTGSVINTNKNGSGYKLSDCIDEINALRWINPITLSGFQPVVATSGSNIHFDVWLDDSTGMIGGTGVYGSGTSSTTFNYSYLEPLFDKSITSLLNSNIVNLQTWVRRRCGWKSNVEDASGHDPVLPPCRPPLSTTVGTNATVNCKGDEVVSGSWLISYGCSSYVCKTRYYIPSVRCPCSTVYRCNGDGTLTGGEVPHPFNQEQPINSGVWGGGYSITQPLLYMCEYNFHPQCDIPMLIKTPFQIHSNDDSSILYQCGDAPLLPGYCEFCCPESPLLSNIYGWCQYMDPNGPKIQEEDIPRDNPPISYIAQRGIGVFCSTHPWNYDPFNVQPGSIPDAIEIVNGGAFFNLPEGCNVDGIDCEGGGSSCPSCGNWDRIDNLGLVYDYGIVYPEGQILSALTRPIVSPITQSDVCGEGCSRLDIDCSTACCECGFVCNPSNSGCFDLKVHHPFTQTTTYTESFTETGGPILCVFTNLDFDTCGQINPGVCSINIFPGVSYIPNVWGGSYSTDLEISVTRITTTCGCVVNGGDNACFDTVATWSPSCPGAISECISWTNPPAPTSNPTCFTCNNLSVGISDNSCCAGCYSAFQRGTICDNGTVLVDFVTDEYVSNCGSGVYDACGYGTTYNRAEYRLIAEGTSTVDGASLGWFNLDPTYDYHFTYIRILEQNSVNNEPSWGSCNYDTITGKDFDYITHWEQNAEWFCGYPNIAYATGNIIEEPRFKGSTCE